MSGETAGSAHGQRAETWLRLRAEDELRRICALPPEDSGTAVAWAGPAGRAAALTRQVIGPAEDEVARRAVAAAQAAARRLAPAAEEAGQNLEALADRAAAALSPALQNAADRLTPAVTAAARQVLPVAADAARTWQPVAADAARRLQPLAEPAAGAWHRLERWRSRGIARYARGLSRRYSNAGDRAAQLGLARLQSVAGALCLAGALDEATAGEVLAGLETALIARGRLSPARMQFPHPRHECAARPAPAGSYRAVPAGVTMAAGRAAGLGDTQLFALVIAPDRAFVTAEGQAAEGLPDRHAVAAMRTFPFAGEIGAADNLGTSYRLRMNSCSWDDTGAWTGMLHLAPLPPAGSRWLDLRLGEAAVPVRIPLPAAPGSGPAGPGPGAPPPGEHGCADLAPPPGPPRWLLDQRAESMLTGALDPGPGGRHSLADMADVADALAAAGALGPAQPALDRLVTLARRLSVPVPDGLAARAGAAQLPAAWEDVLASPDHPPQAGQAAAGCAGVLPELAGTRHVTAGLTSTGDGTVLRTASWGNPPPGPLAGWHHESNWSWWARDDLGHWHVGSAESGGRSDGFAHSEIRLWPPVPAAATELEVYLTAPEGRVCAVIPLAWQEQP